MIRAIGFCDDAFHPEDPGRLCRGRERWIDSFDLDEAPKLHRIVISGAAFTDDSARDAQRGLPFSGVSLGRTIRTLFPDGVLVACAEEGHPRRVPEGASGIEHYPNRRPGGSLEDWVTRWTLACPSSDEVDQALACGADVVLVFPSGSTLTDGKKTLEEFRFYDAPLADAEIDEARTQGPGLPEGIRKSLFQLMGFRQGGQPARRFQAAAIPELLSHVDAVILLHSDKHAGCLGVYTFDDLQAVPMLKGLAADQEALTVPFAIPPMLARWDRAIWELRQGWDEETQGEFPVPPSPIGGWNRRGSGPTQSSAENAPPVAEAFPAEEPVEEPVEE